MHQPADTMYAIEDFIIRHKAKLTVTLVSTFVFLWLTGMTAGITAAACRKDRMEPEKRVVYCNISLTAGMAFDVFPREYRRRSLVQLHRGIAYLQSDQPEKARADFDGALTVLMKYHKNETLHETHMGIIARHADPRVEPFWRATLDAMIAQAEHAEGADPAKIRN